MGRHFMAKHLLPANAPQKFRKRKLRSRGWLLARVVSTLQKTAAV
jgi:hypothetical protein